MPCTSCPRQGNHPRPLRTVQEAKRSVRLKHAFIYIAWTPVCRSPGANAKDLRNSGDSFGIPHLDGDMRYPTLLLLDCGERLVLGEPDSQRVDPIAGLVPEEKWHAYLIKEGSKGPRVAQVAFLRGVVVRDGLPGVGWGWCCGVDGERMRN